MPPRNRVIIDNRFGRLLREVDIGLQLALREGARVTGEAGQAVGSRYDTAEIQANWQIGPPRRTRKGWEIDIVWKDWRALWFEKGTHAKRGALRSRRQNTASGNRGIRPVRFARKGMRAGQSVLIDAVRRHFPRI